MHFNTSHVSINHLRRGGIGVFINISIHLMFLLIATNTVLSPPKSYFNTSHVSINHKGQYYKMALDGFQYISCFY